jgi:hypothetical protein
MADIAGSLQKQGIPRLCIVNSHLEPDHIAAIHEFCAQQKGMTILFPDKTRKPWASLLTAEFKQGACHAGSYETSLVMSVREDLVRESRKDLAPNPVNLAVLMKQGVKTFREAGAHDAYFGDPAAATREEGEQTYLVLTRMVVETVERTLLTPKGLRSLAPGEPGYRARYDGDVWQRDGSYHQGTVWPWLVGPFVEAWLRVRGGSQTALDEARHRFLPPLYEHLREAGLGHISEIMDADPPHTPRGCPFQAWSLGELLRPEHVVLRPSPVG